MSGLRIGVDALTVTARPAGVGRAVAGYVAGLAAQPGEHSLVAVRPVDSALPRTLERTEWIEAPVPIPDTPRALLWQHLRMPGLLRARGIDVYLGPAFVLPFRSAGVPEVVVFYDASWRRFPESKSLQFRRYMDAVVPASMRRAARVVACSNFAADEARWLEPRLSASRIAVVPCGVSLGSATASGEAPPVRGPYLLTVSNFDTRKNLPRLVAAWRACRRRGLPHALVLVGDPERAARLRAAVGAAADEPLVTPGYVTDDVLRSLYANAGGVLVPSLYEGFGLPVVEALAAGAPVACANAASLPEVAAGDAELFDPLDEDAIAAAIERLVRAPPSPDQRRAAAERVRAMTWQRAGALLLDVLTSAARS